MKVVLCALLPLCMCTVGSQLQRDHKLLKPKLSTDHVGYTSKAQNAATVRDDYLLVFTSTSHAVPAEDCGSEGQVRELHAVVVPCLPAQSLWRGGRQGRLLCSIQVLSFRV